MKKIFFGIILLCGPVFGRPSLNDLAPIVPPEREAMKNPQGYEFATRSGVGFGIQAGAAEGKITSFSYSNTYSPRINPFGENRVPIRTFNWNFKERAAHNMHLAIYEFAIPGGRDSHTSMFTHLWFYPRKNLPALQVNAAEQTMDLILPTSEVVTFDLATKEVISGVLRENTPIDRNPNRFERGFADISYLGTGVMIRITARGQTPESRWVFGKKTNKKATVYYGQKKCSIYVGKLWEQDSRPDGDVFPIFKFPKDADFFQFLKRECGWNIKI